MFLFFFQAEDGIRDIGVTGVQTCALPISGRAAGFWPGPCPDLPPRSRPPRRVPPRPRPGSVPSSPLQIGRASCRERVQISVVAVSLKKNKSISCHHHLLFLRDPSLSLAHY